MSIADSIKDTTLDQIRTIDTYMALFNGDPLSTGTEVTGTNGLVRAHIVATTGWTSISSITVDSLPGRRLTPSASIVNTLNSTGVVTVSHLALFDASSGGNIKASKAVAGGPYTIPSGSQIGFQYLSGFSITVLAAA